MDGHTLMLLKIYCSDGVVRIGEGTPIAGMAYWLESPESMKLAIDACFAPAMIGMDATRIERLMGDVGKLLKFTHFSNSTLDTALLDAHGKRLSVPVSELLGGRHVDHAYPRTYGCEYPGRHGGRGRRRDQGARKKAYSQELQRSGKWAPYLALVGEYGNYIVFDVESNAELHDIMTGLPLLPYMMTDVTHLCSHPSSMRDDDA
jgi:muconolactone delta-isomerase